LDSTNKFFTKIQPFINNFLETNKNTLSTDTLSTIRNLFYEVTLMVENIYRKEILKDKFNLDLDLTAYPEWDEKPGQSFIQKFNPCEICGQIRVIHQCHIIPRNEGGADKTGNYVILCANHHHLFDRYKLEKEEWGKLDWSKKPIEVQQYVKNVRLPRQKMYWKYKVTGIEGCQCGSTEFDISFEEFKNNGITPYSGVTRILKCKLCGESYFDHTYSGYEYEWWWEFVIGKIKSGEFSLFLNSSKKS